MILASVTDPNAVSDIWTIAAAIAIAVLGGAIRVGTPILYVSLGECLTEKSGRVNLGLEGTLVMGAMSGYGISYVSSSLGGIPRRSVPGSASWPPASSACSWAACTP